MIDPGQPTFPALNNADGFVLTSGIIIANTTSGYVTLSGTCTHQGITVSYLSFNNTFTCPFHGSVFSAAGSVLNGPASSPLRRKTVAKEENILTISNNEDQNIYAR